jgi:hypothetical protein
LGDDFLAGSVASRQAFPNALPTFSMVLVPNVPP